MKILGIMGSPRLKSNTDLLLEEALRGAQSLGAEIEKIIVDKLDITPCREYYGCLKDGNCVIRDDMDDIYPKLVAADGIIVASPIFFYGLSAQLKALVDRSNCVYEIIIDGATEEAVKRAMKVGIEATVKVPNINRISAGNYGGKLGKFQYKLHELGLG